MIAQWEPTTSQLYSQISDWIGHQKPRPRKAPWTVEAERIYKDLPGTREKLEVNALRIETPDGSIRLEPIGLRDGRVVVEMYAWPTLVRVRLLSKPNSPNWEIVTDDGIPFRWEWNEATFVQLVKDLSVLP